MLIEQAYYTHCTYGTCAVERRGGDMKDHTRGYSIRAASVDKNDLQQCKRQLSGVVAYELPDGFTKQEKLDLDPAKAPQRLLFVPELKEARSKPIQLVGLVSHRLQDTKGRAGSYFGHVVFSENSEPWTTVECLQLWGATDWIDTDTQGSGGHDLEKLNKLSELTSGTDPLIDDALLFSFLTTEKELTNPSAAEQIIPLAWREKTVDQRQQLMEDLLRGFIQVAASRDSSLLLAAEPGFAALLFYGVVRLLPPGLLNENLSFSTYESDLDRISTRLTATTFKDTDTGDLTDYHYRSKHFALNTFSGRMSKFQKKARMAAFPQLIREKLATGDNLATIDTFLQSFVEHLQDINSEDDYLKGLEELAAADVLGASFLTNPKQSEDWQAWKIGKNRLRQKVRKELLQLDHDSELRRQLMADKERLLTILILVSTKDGTSEAEAKSIERLSCDGLLATTRQASHQPNEIETPPPKAAAEIGLVVEHDSSDAASKTDGHDDQEAIVEPDQEQSPQLISATPPDHGVRKTPAEKTDSDEANWERELNELESNTNSSTLASQDSAKQEQTDTKPTDKSPVKNSDGPATTTADSAPIEVSDSEEQKTADALIVRFVKHADVANRYRVRMLTEYFGCRNRIPRGLEFLWEKHQAVIVAALTGLNESDRQRTVKVLFDNVAAPEKHYLYLALAAAHVSDKSFPDTRSNILQRLQTGENDNGEPEMFPFLRDHESEFLKGYQESGEDGPLCLFVDELLDILPEDSHQLSKRLEVLQSIKEHNLLQPHQTDCLHHWNNVTSGFEKIQTLREEHAGSWRRLFPGKHYYEQLESRFERIADEFLTALGGVNQSEAKKRSRALWRIKNVLLVDDDRLPHLPEELHTQLPKRFSVGFKRIKLQRTNLTPVVRFCRTTPGKIALLCVAVLVGFPIAWSNWPASDSTNKVEPPDTKQASKDVPAVDLSAGTNDTNSNVPKTRVDGKTANEANTDLTSTDLDPLVQAQLDQAKKEIAAKKKAALEAEQQRIQDEQRRRLNPKRHSKSRFQTVQSESAKQLIAEVVVDQTVLPRLSDTKAESKRQILEHISTEENYERLTLYGINHLNQYLKKVHDGPMPPKLVTNVEDKLLVVSVEQPTAEAIELCEFRLANESIDFRWHYVGDEQISKFQSVLQLCILELKAPKGFKSRLLSLWPVRTMAKRKLRSSKTLAFNEHQYPFKNTGYRLRLHDGLILFRIPKPEEGLKLEGPQPKDVPIQIQEMKTIPIHFSSKNSHTARFTKLEQELRVPKIELVLNKRGGLELILEPTVESIISRLEPLGKELKRLEDSNNTAEANLARFLKTDQRNDKANAKFNNSWKHLGKQVDIKKGVDANASVAIKTMQIDRIRTKVAAKLKRLRNEIAALAKTRRDVAAAKKRMNRGEAILSELRVYRDIEDIRADMVWIGANEFKSRQTDNSQETSQNKDHKKINQTTPKTDPQASNTSTTNNDNRGIDRNR